MTVEEFETKEEALELIDTLWNVNKHKKYNCVKGRGN